MKSALAAKDKVCVSSKEICISDISYLISSVQRDPRKAFYGGLKGKNETKKSQNTYFFVKKVRKKLDKSNKYAKL